jgi:hypothetical protein
MDDAVRRLADAVLYEGYLLYPYRASSVKNRHRFNFGVLYPRSFASGVDRWDLRCECLATSPEVSVVLRFLNQGVEREVSTPGDFDLGSLSISVNPVDDIWKVTVIVENRSLFEGTDRDEALDHSLVSAHLVLGGSFISLLDPPPQYAEAAAACRNDGVFPVLVGARSMLASPIILYDHPKVAPESHGDLFDGTEIDEILSLRIMTMTDAEKAEACAGDERARRLIERTDRLNAEQLMQLHGRIETPYRVGQRVRLHPRKNADIFDMALAGRTAVIESVEEDYESNLHLAVIVDDDPGRDLGLLRQPGHRFFFSPEEVEVLP